jgi:hypothetical protein
MDLGFGPRLSRVAAGVCFLLFLGVLQYFFGFWMMLGVMLLPFLLGLFVLIFLPSSPGRKKIIDWGFRYLDVSDFFMERLDDRFASLIRLLRR